MKIGIVGMGWVGSSVAVSTLHSGLPTELLVSDIRPQLAEGEAMDLAHGAAFYPSARVRAAEVEEMVDADAVVIAAGRGGSGGETRLELLRDNAGIIETIAAKLRHLRGLLVVVSNPVDVLTSVAQRASGLDPARVIGTGTMLDTARLRQVLGQRLHLEPRSIHAQVVGEHGDSEVVLWSGAQIGGLPLRQWPGWKRDDEPELSTVVRRAAYEIISRKGATNHAIGLVTASLLRWSLRGERRVLTVSRVQDGALGLSGVSLSLPAVVGRDGATQVLEPAMDDHERDAVLHSAELLRSAQASIGF
ncbi:MAG: L-lactate dehydrogenase [Deltaproteobacteria bacterium]|nr:L-lactate dehydrogenase [Deltaproteobacteria bacterium]